MLKRLLAYFRPASEIINLAPPIQTRWPKPEGVGDGFVDMTEPQLRHIYQNATCPYCNGDLYDGPSGGMMRNMFCENVDTCDSRFNVGDRGLGSFLPVGQFTGPCPDGFKDQIHAMKSNGEQ